ncbi:MAG: STAS domain-containing protein [Miltoncostaeaceae bacterium]
MGLDVTTDRQSDLTVAVLSGELDIYTVAGFKQDLDEIDPASELLVIDLSDVSLLDSSGLGALVSMLNQARAGDRPLGVVCPHRRLRRVFEITGLRRAFVFGDDLDAVRGALADGAD